ncbi:MAG: hypothetical protein JNJ89_07080 [Rubrivivax sp.]|nr:hypothetical protein [Rubrivivax sp.]
MRRSNPHRRRSTRRLPWWIRRAVRLWARCAGRLAGPAGTGALHAPAGEEFELPAGVPPDERRCGWFDSSLDLREGLAVSEHDGGDPVVAELTVPAWVQLQLGGWQPEASLAAA